MYLGWGCLKGSTNYVPVSATKNAVFATYSDSEGVNNLPSAIKRSSSKNNGQKYLNPSLSCDYSTYGSDHPLKLFLSFQLQSYTYRSVAWILSRLLVRPHVPFPSLPPTLTVGSSFTVGGAIMSYMLPHLHNGWQVDQAILSEEERVVVIR